jgi:hypothetical protein
MSDPLAVVRQALSDLADAATRGAMRLSTAAMAPEMKLINDAYKAGCEALRDIEEKQP